MTVFSFSSMVLPRSHGQSIVITGIVVELIDSWGDGVNGVRGVKNSIITHPAFSGSSGRCIVSAMMDNMV